MSENRIIPNSKKATLRRFEAWEMNRANTRIEQAEKLIRAATISGDRAGQQIGEAQLQRWLAESKSLIAMHKAR